MAARIGILLTLVLALLGGLAWMTTSGDKGGSDALTGGAPVPRGPDARPEASLAPIAQGEVVRGGRESVRGATTRRQAPAGEDGTITEVEEVVLTVRAADGRPILEALAEWGLSRHRLTCVGSRNAPSRHRHRPMPSARAPYRFATMQPAVFDGDTTFRVVARQRPCFLSVLVSGVVVKTERIGEGTSDVAVHLTEGEVRGALGGVRLCVVADSATSAPRARAYLRRESAGGSDSIEQFVALVESDGCLQFQDVPPGEYQLAIYANRYATTFLAVEVEPSRVVELGDVPLESPVAVVGTLIGDKRFLANRQVSIQVVDRSQPVVRCTELRKVSTDSQGTFRVFDLAPGEYALHVVQPSTRGGPGVGGWPISRAVVVDTRDGGQQQVELALEEAHLLVMRSVLTRDVNVQLRDEAGVTVLRVPLGPRGVRQVGVLPGRYEMLATSGGAEVERKFVQTPPTLTAIVGD